MLTQLPDLTPGVLLQHPDVGVGQFVRQFNRPVYGLAIVIKLPGGRQWYAPAWEFTKA